jgi:hypothetical protein
LSREREQPAECGGEHGSGSEDECHDGMLPALTSLTQLTCVKVLSCEARA